MVPRYARFCSLYAEKHYTSFPITVPSFVFLAHSSSSQFEAGHKTNDNNFDNSNNNNNEPAQFQWSSANRG